MGFKDKFIVIVLSIIVIAIVASFAGSAGSNTGKQTLSAISALSASGVTYKDILFCKTCIIKSKCIRPEGCIKMKDGGSTCEKLKPTCDEINDRIKNYVPEGPPASREDSRVSFDGTFLPGAKLKIILPDALRTAEAYVPGNFLVRINGEKQEIFLEGSAVCTNGVPDDPSKGCVYFPIALADTGDTTKTQPYIILPYKRNGYNEEELLQKGKGYTMDFWVKASTGTVLPADCEAKGLCMLKGTDKYLFWGAMANGVWNCPSPLFYANSKYEQKKDVVFSFSPEWVRYELSSSSDEAKVQVGKRHKKSIWEKLSPWEKNGCYDASVETDTCYQEVSKPDQTKEQYAFKMPYVVPDTDVEISYPVYAKNKDGTNIVIKNPVGSTPPEVPMCRWAPEKPLVWQCPVSVCNNVDTPPKIFVFSKSSSGTSVPGNPGCKYAKGGECAKACGTTSSKDKDGNEIASAACILPKPEIDRVFVLAKIFSNPPTQQECATQEVVKKKCDGSTTCKIGTCSTQATMEFSAAKGTYVAKDLLLTNTNHNAKSLIAVIKNNAEPADAGMGVLDIKAEEIKVSAIIDNDAEHPIAGSPVPSTMWYKKEGVWKYYSLDVCPTVTPPAVGICEQISADGSGGMLKKAIAPGEYFEYDIPIPDSIRDIPQPSSHTAHISATVASGVSVDSGSLAPKEYTYTVLAGDCKECIGLIKTACEGSICGGRCEWVGGTGSASHCAKK